MTTLWFRKRYVDAIVRGDKRVTVRRASSHPPAGARVTLHVGPRPAFAEAVIVAVESITLDDCERLYALDGHTSADEMRDALVDAYGDDDLVLVRFRVTSRRRGKGSTPDARPRHPVTCT